MPLSRLISVVSAYLGGALDVPSLGVGGFYPTQAIELPRITLYVSEAQQELAGVGRRPRAEVEGALPVSIAIDLADPVVVFPDESVNLISDAGRVLALPHGPVVRGDGLTTLPFSAADVTARLDGAPLTLVNAAPAAGQFAIDPLQGRLTFGTALGNSGTLEIGYHVGRWETQVFRMQGELTAELFAGTTAQIDQISEGVLEALRLPGALPPVGRLIPTGYGPIDLLGPSRANARTRKLTFAFDYELEEPVIRTGGGIITRISVDAVLDDETEHFDVTGEE